MQGPPANAQENARNNIIREIVETERKYVQDLEHMQVRVPLDFQLITLYGANHSCAEIRGCFEFK